MSRFSDAAREIVKRHPAPAVSVDELKDLLSGELPTAGLEHLDDAVVQRLALEARPLRLMTPPRRRWLRPLGPIGWVVDGADAGAGASSRRSLEGRLRSSLLRLGRAVDPESALSWARWNRLLEEERALRRHLNRRRPEREGGEPPPPP